MIRKLGVLTLAASLLLPALGAAETFVVEMRTVSGVPSFVPADLTIRTGDTVEWVNMDLQLEHATASGTGSADPDYGFEWQSPLLGYGEAYQHTFFEAGTYEYFSVPHEFEGMFGVVRVTSDTGTGGGVETSTWGVIKHTFSDLLPRD